MKEKARKFAIIAHRGQVRKADKEKPMIIHPINVAQILEEYGFDENVIAAGYLHDVVEDTKYNITDIGKKFNEDIMSLVSGDSELDKSLSWEIRKQTIIDSIKELDLRHKAVICADKISNLEDLIIIIKKNGNFDFSDFNRGYDKQKWYYNEIYKSLINNEDKNYPMFIRLKKLIDCVFDDIINNYVRDVIFLDNEQEYNELLKIHYKKEEVFKLKNVLLKNRPYVIEFTGTPRTGKTSLINNLYDFFRKKGFKVEVLEEFTTSKYYKKNVYPLLKDEYKNVVNTEIPKYVLKQLEDKIKTKPDIIIIDRSLFDRLIWVDRLYNKGGMTDKEYNDYKELYIPLIKDKINIIISTYADSLTALKRDYNANISLEERNFLNKNNIDEYNNALLNMKELSIIENINFNLFDTTNKNQRIISIEVANVILDNMRRVYLDEIYKELK